MSVDSGASGTGGQLADQLDGRTFLSSTTIGRDLVRGATIHVDFRGDRRLKVYAGCNHISGNLRWDGQRLSVDQLSITEMACEQSLMDQDEWLATLLQSGLDAYLDGDALTLTAEGVSLQLIDRRAADPDRPLENTTWTLDGVISGSGPTRALSSVPQDITATLLIAEGRIRFFDGCSDYDGAVNVTTNTVQVRDEITSSPARSGAAGADAIDVSILTQDFHYQIAAHQLTVTGAGDAGLMFVAISDATTRVRH